jgi:putative autoinducer-2 (AI-2) aldolase
MMSSSSWGKQNRLNEIFQDDGKCLILPIDHGYFLGPVTNLEKPWETIEPLLSHADATFMTRGVLRQCIPADFSTPVVLRVSGGTSITQGDLANEGLTTSMSDAVRLNVSAVGVSIFVGSDHQRQTLLNLSKVVENSQEYNIPVMAVTAVGDELEKRDVKYLSHSCRVAAELGANVVKTYWCEEFERVIETCPAPVVIAGGPKVDSEREVFEFIYDGISKGAAGINLGRNIWQHNNPVAMIKALYAIVHHGATAAEAEELFEAEQ